MATMTDNGFIAYTTLISNDYGDDIINLKYNSDGTLKYDSYLGYLIKMNALYVEVKDYGMSAVELKNYLNEFFVDKNLDMNARRTVLEKDMYITIYDNIKNDSPVVLHISHVIGAANKGVYDDEVIDLYILDNNRFIQKEKVGEHHVVIAGILFDTINSTIWLKISSWGEFYYINYNEFIDYKTSNKFRNDGCSIVSIGD